MKTDAILNADVLDIIFDNRNKQYGAYTLRKFYNNRLYKALGLTFTFAASMLALSFIVKEKEIKNPIISDTICLLAPPVDKIPEPKKPKEQAAVQKPATPKIKPATQIYANNIIITPDNVAGPIKDLQDNVAIGTENITGVPGEIIKVIPKTPEVPVSGGGDGDPVKPAIDKTTPNNYAEVMPLYPGGMAALRKFLERNLTNPQDIDEGENVVVKIRFIVGYDGTLKGFETIQDGGTAFNNEVIRVLKKMPQWIPGKTKGENVSVYFTIPVNFLAAQ